MTSEATPAWFSDAVAHRPLHLDTTVRDCRVHLRCWGEPGLPGVVLVHGGSANSGWWDHVAPLLAATHRVVALDLSGHGDSGWRPVYSMSEWALEVVAAAEAASAAGPLTVVGHSMGGWVAAHVGAEHGDRLAGLVIIDSPFQESPPEELLRRRRKPTKVYPTRAEIMDRFVTTPPQELLLPYVREHVAAESIRTVEDGYTWKFDSMRVMQRPQVREVLAALRTRTTFIRCESGLVSPAMAQDISKLMGNPARVVDLPLAGHHPMFDQPLSLVTALRTLVAQWAEPADTVTQAVRRPTTAGDTSSTR